MNTTLLFMLARYAATLTAGFALAWVWQGNTIDNVKLKSENTILKVKGEAKDERISQQRAARVAIERSVQRTMSAQLEAANRSIALRNSSRDSALALDSVLNASASAVRAAASDTAACKRVSAAQGDVFRQCSAELQTLAEDAGRCSNAFQLIQEARSK